MKAASRILQVQDPIIPLIAEMIAATPGTISLGQGVVGYPPPAEARERITAFFDSPRNNLYQPVGGVPELIERIHIKLAEDNDVLLGEESTVMVTAGANMAFFNALLAIADVGDEVILLAPYYFNHEMAIRMVGCTPIVVSTDEQYQPVVSEIARAITPRTKAVVTISPNNPTGAVYPGSALETINSLCRERGIYHISDEAYEYFVFDGAKHVSPRSFTGSAEYTISLYSLSKSHGFASWRIGYLVAPKHLERSLKKIQDTILICPPVISQHAAVGALSVGGAFCRAKIAELMPIRAALLERFKEIDDCCFLAAPCGALYFFLKVHTKHDSLSAATRLIKEFKVAVIPGMTFGMSSGCYLRVSFGAITSDTATEGISRLLAGIRALAAER